GERELQVARGGAAEDLVLPVDARAVQPAQGVRGEAPHPTAVGEHGGIAVHVAGGLVHIPGVVAHAEHVELTHHLRHARGVVEADLPRLAASPCVTVAPGTLPCSACCRLTTAVFCSWSGGTDATAPVRSALRWVPYPTTTTSDRVTAIGWIAKFSVTICPAVTATVSSRAAK